MGRLLYAITALGRIKHTGPARGGGRAVVRISRAQCADHIAENRDEVAFVTKLFPERKDFLDVYEYYGLVGRRTVLGHCVWFSDSEFARVHECDASIVHCPTSNFFLGSGLFRLRLAKKSEASDPCWPRH